MDDLTPLLSYDGLTGELNLSFIGVYQVGDDTYVAISWSKVFKVDNRRLVEVDMSPSAVFCRRDTGLLLDISAGEMERPHSHNSTYIESIEEYRAGWRKYRKSRRECYKRKVYRDVTRGDTREIVFATVRVHLTDDLAELTASFVLR